MAQLEAFLSTCPATHRLGALYLLDSVLKGSKSELGNDNVYQVRVSQRIEPIITAALECAPQDKVPP